MDIISQAKGRAKVRDWRVLYIRPDGPEGKKLYLDTCGGFTQVKSNARVFKTEGEWRQALRWFARKKVFMTLDPYDHEPELSDRNKMSGD